MVAIVYGDRTTPAYPRSVPPSDGAAVSASLTLFGVGASRRGGAGVGRGAREEGFVPREASCPR